jgi:signal transduction histidine kinase/CheY-like chemotaxis protein
LASLDAPPRPPLGSTADGAQFVRAVGASIPVYLFATAGAAIVGVVHWGGGPRPALGAWLALFCTLTLMRLCATTVFLVRRPPPSAYARWARLGTLIALAQATLWGALSFVLFPRPGSPEQEAVLHVVLCATAMGAAVHLSPVPRILVAYVACVLVPLVLRDLLLADPFHLVMAALGLLTGVYTLIIARGQARALAEILEQRRRNAALVEALHAENARSEQARLAVEGASAARTRFFAAANHDLRQPLNAIGLLAQSLRHVRDRDDVGEVADHLDSCVDGMTDVVDELLEITRMDAGSLQPEVGIVRLDQIARECCRQFEIAARAKGLAVEIDVPEIHVHSDREMLGRILGNLLANAIRYTASGRILVQARSEATVWIAVEDTGIGIAPEYLERIFEEFFQVGNPGRDRRLGLGLGLATVKRLCELVGHRVAVTSSPGAGSRFTVSLGPAADASLPAPASLAAPVAPLSANRRVLVIEDDHDARAAIERLLRAWGSDVRAVAALAPALELVSGGFRPDAAIVDLRLAEGADGIDAVRRLREACGASLPALIVTGDANSDALADARLAAVPVILKPIRPARLRAFLTQAFAT